MSSSPRHGGALPSDSLHSHHRKENLKQKDFMGDKETGVGEWGKRVLTLWVQATGAEGETEWGDL